MFGMKDIICSILSGLGGRALNQIGNPPRFRHKVDRVGRQ